MDKKPVQDFLLPVKREKKNAPEFKDGNNILCAILCITSKMIHGQI